MPGKGMLTLTGLLGESMRESAQAALELPAQPRQGAAASTRRKFSKTDLHIHVPAGAVPKDGPSAGVAIAAALISLFRDQPIHPNLAMTGEVTLTGRVLPVGGVREKILAARRAGITTVLIPAHNEKDLVELPAEVKADLTFHPVDTLDDVVPRLFPSLSQPKKSKATPARGKSAAKSKVLPGHAIKPSRPTNPRAGPARFESRSDLLAMSDDVRLSWKRQAFGRLGFRAWRFANRFQRFEQARNVFSLPRRCPITETTPTACPTQGTVPGVTIRRQEVVRHATFSL